MAKMKQVKLTWVNSLKQWRKRRKVGDRTKTFYLGTGNGKGDAVSYERALKKWESIEARLDVSDAQTEATKLAEKYRKAYAHLPEYIPSSVESSPGESNLPDAYYRNLKHNSVAGGKSDAPVRKVADLVDDYVAAQRRRYEHGLRFPNAPQEDRISPARFIAYQNCGDTMKKVWGNALMPTNEAEMFGLMKQFRDSQQDVMNNGKSASTFNERIKTMAHFVRWMFNNYHLTALPRNWEKLVSRYRVKSSARALEIPLVRKIFDAADDRLKCWIALACQCGFYSMDIAHLTADMVQGRYLVLDRHKTGVPTRFKLWAVTKKLLARTANKTGYLFTTPTGELMSIIDVAKRSRKSRIDNQLTILKRKLKIKQVSFSNFRDTSSTKVESIDPTLTDLFDGHADARMARWYIDHAQLDKDAHFAKLDRAIDALEKWYGLKLDDEQPAAAP